MPYRILSTLLALGLVILALAGPLDRLGLSQTQAGFTRALVTYGLVRAMNGVISVAQGTELALEPAGIGVTFTPGEILDPINDLVERFALVLLVAATTWLSPVRS